MLSGIVAATTSTPGVTSDGTTATTASSQLGQNSFLNLLVAQLQNQDPTNAQDPTQMVAEMASFSSLEAQQSTNTLLASIQAQNSAIYQAQAAGLVGKNVEVDSSSLTLSGGKANIAVNMASAGNATLTIKNSTGQVVATLGPGALAAGDNTIPWNGQNAYGTQLADGAYTVSVAATDGSGNAITANTQTSALVTGISFANNAVQITAGGNQYPLTSINSILSN